MEKIKNKFVLILIMGVMLIPFIPLSETNVSAEVEFKEIKEVNGVLTVEFDSKEEEEFFLSELEKNNAYSLKLWEEALAKSDDGIVMETVQNSTVSDLNNVRPTAHALNTVYTTFNIGLNYISLGATVSYDKTNNRFGTIYGTSLFSRFSSDSVSNVITKYTKIDNSRTLATTSTYRINVSSGSGGSTPYPVRSYYEFYASSSGGTWFSNNVQ